MVKKTIKGVSGVLECKELAPSEFLWTSVLRSCPSPLKATSLQQPPCLLGLLA
ncbi:hypothetical protein DPMN_165765 [Dreissena polymorpha]|uniref:Uncharacterized protein n=1 Tax=Dreissena polymorpha TaxID=45954 RepID=A0A9D4IXA8_DREPO|nr:hypothetical protein DPMN_165765 [Dreissena polymorpha]